MPASLATILRKHRADALISQAQTIRDYREGPERTKEAERQVREAMLQRAIGNITAEEEHRVFSILNFVMPRDGADQDEGPGSPALGE